MAQNSIKIEHILVGEGIEQRKIAFKHQAFESHNDPLGMVWLGGYRSDMESTKAIEIEAFAIKNNLASTRFDYSGHGQSGGAFFDGSISRWLEDSLAVFKQVTKGRQILIASSMGAWIALRLIEKLKQEGLADRICGLLLLAPAPDFTMRLMEPELSENQKTDLNEKGYFEEPTPYAPEPNRFTQLLFEDGRKNEVMNGEVITDCPVHIIQGMADADVPYQHAIDLMEQMSHDSTTMTLVHDGDHRLSRESDIKRMLGALEGLIKLA